jgi:hypothetical protein
MTCWEFIEHDASSVASDFAIEIAVDNSPVRRILAIASRAQRSLGTAVLRAGAA